jgi:hypothetical protein
LSFGGVFGKTVAREATGPQSLGSKALMEPQH